MNKILLLAIALVPNCSLGAETLIAEAPNKKFSIYAVGQPAPILRIDDGRRLVGEEMPFELKIQFRDSEDRVIHEQTEALPPVSAEWSPDSSSVIIHGHGYRSFHDHRLYAVTAKAVEAIPIDNDALRDVLSKDHREASLREWDASLADPPFPFAKKKWIFHPFDWTDDGLLRISVIECARNVEQPHPFQQQVCSYIIYLDPSAKFAPVKLTATSQRTRSEHKTIWEVDGPTKEQESEQDGGGQPATRPKSK